LIDTLLLIPSLTPSTTRTERSERRRTPPEPPSPLVRKCPVWSSSKLLELEYASVQLRRDELHREHRRRDLDLDAAVVLPKALDLVHLQFAAIEHHGEIRRVERVVRETQLYALELVPHNIRPSRQIGVVSRFGFVHLADRQTAESVKPSVTIRAFALSLVGQILKFFFGHSHFVSITASFLRICIASCSVCSTYWSIAVLRSALFVANHKLQLTHATSTQPRLDCVNSVPPQNPHRG